MNKVIIQNQIDRGLTNVIITFRGRKEFVNGRPVMASRWTSSMYRGIDTVEKFENLMKLVESHPNGVSVGWSD